MSETPEPIALSDLIDQLTAAAENKQIALGAVQTTIEKAMAKARAVAIADDEDATIETPDVTAVLEGLMARGIEVYDDFDESDLEKAVTKAAAYLSGEPAELDAYSQWRRDAAHHRILNAGEERELTTRLSFLRKSARALSNSVGRLEAKRAELLLEATKKRELIDLLGEDPDSAKMIATPQAALDELQAKVAELDPEIEKLSEEQRITEGKAREVRSEFLGYNYRLVLFWATKLHEINRRRTDLMDLIQQGNLGMLDAIDKFDPLKGFKFSTFACFHIRQKISEYTLEQSNAIRVPVHRHRDAIKINQYRAQFLRDNGRGPTIEEIGEQLGKTPKKILEILDAEVKSSTASLDKPLTTEDDSSAMGDLIADAAALSPEEVAVRQALAGGLKEAFEEVLNARERRVLQLRFGLHDEMPQTLEWIGRRMNVTRERVRQIEAKALEKLSKHGVVREMAGADEPERVSAIAARSRRAS